MCRLLLLPILLLSATLSVSQKTYDYPIVPKDSIYDKYHGITIYDPYQWMENPEDPRLAEWIKTQKKINAKQQRKQGRQQTLLAQTASMYNDKQTTEIKENIVKEKRKLSKYDFNYYWSSYNRAQDLRYRKRGDVIYKSLVKIKHFQEDRHDLAIITDYDVNEKTDVAFMAISHKGSDWRELHFYDLKTGEKLPDTLLYVRNGFDFIWHDDGLYYTRFEAPKKGRELLDVPVGQSMYFHKMGTKQHKDKLLYENKDTTGATFFGFTEIDSLLFLHHYYYHGEKTYKALSYEHIGVLDSFKLSTFLIYPNKKDIVLSPQYSYGDSILIVTNWNAPNWKVLVANTKEKNKLSEFIPEYDIPLSEVNPFGKDKLACIYKNDGGYTALIHNMQGELIKMQGFPAGKKLNYFYENSKNVHYTSFCLSSFYHPDLWYQISLDDYTVKPIQELSLPYNPFEIETKYVTYKSKDGTEIPMYITHL
jgi:prolyl oligopeptidase